MIKFTKQQNNITCRKSAFSAATSIAMSEIIRRYLCNLIYFASVPKEEHQIAFIQTLQYQLRKDVRSETPTNKLPDRLKKHHRQAKKESVSVALKRRFGHS